MDSKLTPMMRQYLDIKKKHQNDILFFRMGDFYEMFFEDAREASKILDIALTSRQNDVPIRAASRTTRPTATSHAS